MNDCPNCEYHRQRAARWRAEAYKLGGYDGIQLPWKGLTDEDMAEITSLPIGTCEMMLKVEAKLKEMNT